MLILPVFRTSLPNTQIDQNQYHHPLNRLRDALNLFLQIFFQEQVKLFDIIKSEEKLDVLSQFSKP